MQPTAFRYKHSIAAFREYLDVIAVTKLPVQTIPGQCDDDSDTSVVLTFDDGGSSALIAAELLEERGWRGMFFVTTDLIGKSGFLNTAEVKLLHDRGHTIGSHSCSHPDVFRNLSRGEMQREWNQSRDVLQQLLGSHVATVSVPGGDIDRATIEEAAVAGYQHVFTSEQRTRPWRQAGADCYGRLMMLNSTSAETLQRWLSHPSMGILPERMLRFAKSSVKQIIGPVYSKLMQRRRAQHEHA